jgi:hypothetical protein
VNKKGQTNDSGMPRLFERIIVSPTQQVQKGIARVIKTSDKAFNIGIDEPLLRGIIGALGIILPIVLVCWGYFLVPAYINGQHFLGSISAYYAVRTRDAFVGILFAIGCVLFAYKSYNKVDSYFGKATFICSILVAVFPCIGEDWQSKIHFVFAVSLFAIFAFFSLFLFTKSSAPPGRFWPNIKWFFKYKRPTSGDIAKKRLRNRIYLGCGATILACLLITGLYYWLWQHNFSENTPFPLAMEWIMVWAFGISWLVKSDIIPVLKDKTDLQNKRGA